MSARRVPLAILAGALLCFLLYAFPGFESPDSIWQLYQARTGAYTNWHPPVMAAIWRHADMIYPGPFLMLVLQSTLFLGGVHVLLARVMSPTRAAIVAAFVLLFPPVLTPMAPVWKDALMAGFLVAGIAGLTSRERRWRVVGCAAIFVATAVRYNALAATLPIVVLLFQWRDQAGWRRYALALGVWLAVTGTASLANRLLTRDDQHPWHGSVALFDIAGIARYSGETDDATLRAMLAGVPLVPQTAIAAHVREAYRPDAHHQLWNDDRRLFDPPNPSQLAGVERAWRRLVTGYPGAFLAHRWQLFRHVLGIARTPSGVVYVGETIPSRTPVQHAWISALRAIRSSLLFRPYLYLVLSLALLAMCRARLPFALLASGILCELSLFAAAPSSDYRYSHWMIVTTVLAGIMIFVQRYRNART